MTKAINTMFMILKVRGLVPLHIDLLQKQASLSFTMSDFLSLNMIYELFKYWGMSLSLGAHVLFLPMTPTILRVVTKVVGIHSRATKWGIINRNAGSTWSKSVWCLTSQIMKWSYLENFVYLTQTSEGSLLHRHLSVPVKLKGVPMSMHASRKSLW